MKKTYRYKGFEVAVELEAMREISGNVTLLPPKGFVAIVYVKNVNGHPVAPPVRLTEERQRPFATHADALMAGFSAGQRIIDDMFSR
ncbi:hypothetical protein B0G80_7498 [Paraburkholderia sp. BL6669N2]|uniref:hypothetical protein n=1 Tax=Paraburkholderia sp. BL6669N2 TaxID=1938807 RepID=UPI000E2308F9|nr:hypothetical protein [Paraburkholderia sp. BL6669N2]REG51019.1 hypothetical protein B0G80_7498 [Paraburkholderia sp. BL6669N2]